MNQTANCWNEIMVKFLRGIVLIGVVWLCYILRLYQDVDMIAKACACPQVIVHNIR